MNTKYKITMLMLSLMAFLIISCTKEPPKEVKPELNRPNESFLKTGEDNTTIVELSKVNSSVWIHTTYHDYNGSLTPSNGLVVLTEDGLILIDTPWTDKQMESLDKLCKQSFNVGFKEALITHAHGDRMGGGEYLKDKGIKITSLKRVSDKAVELGFVKPDNIIDGDETKITLNDTDFEIFFPGEGHTVDNSIVWIEKYNLLFAGCLVKEQGVTSLGNISEANLKEWPNTLNKLVERYQNIEIVIPGHGQWGDKTLIDYTLGLFEE